MGAIPYALGRRIHWRIAAAFTPTAMAGAYLGSQLVTSAVITETIQLVSFGLVMLAASVLMIRKGGRKKDKSQTVEKTVEKEIINGANAASTATFPNALAIALEGLGVGSITGVVGVGGGFLIIPALVLLSGIPMKTAVGTSLVIIAANSATGFIGYADHVAINWALTASFTLAAGLGTVLGSRIARSVEASQLQQAFGYFVLSVAIFVLIKR